MIATADPLADEPAKAIRYMLDVRVDLAVIAPAEIERALRTLYQDAVSEPQSEEADSLALAGSDASEFDVERLRDIANEAPVMRLVAERAILTLAEAAQLVEMAEQLVGAVDEVNDHFWVKVRWKISLLRTA